MNFFSRIEAFLDALLLNISELLTEFFSFILDAIGA